MYDVHVYKKKYMASSKSQTQHTESYHLRMFETYAD